MYIDISLDIRRKQKQLDIYLFNMYILIFHSFLTFLPIVKEEVNNFTYLVSTMWTSQEHWIRQIFNLNFD